MLLQRLKYRWLIVRLFSQSRNSPRTTLLITVMLADAFICCFWPNMNRSKCSLLNILIAWLVSHQRSRPSASSLPQNSVPTLNKTSTSVSMKVDADHLHVRNRRSTFMNEPPTVLTDKIRCTLCFQAANWFQGYFYNSSAQKQHTRPPITLSLLQLPQFMPQIGETRCFCCALTVKFK